jgi:hypothetical protein
MRYMVYAERREPITFPTAGEAVSKAWSLMGSGATGLYIYDNVRSRGLFTMRLKACGVESSSLARLSEGANESWCSLTGARPVRVRP